MFLIFYYYKQYCDKFSYTYLPGTCARMSQTCSIVGLKLFNKVATLIHISTSNV